jgi:hypothetical protein
VALLQPLEEPVQAAVPVVSSRPAKRKTNYIDLTDSEKIKRKKESKSRSNKKQIIKRRREREEEKERLKSLSPEEKKQMAKNIINNDKEWGMLDLYNKDNDLTWGSGKKKKKTWLEGREDDEDGDDWWELKKLPQVVAEIDRSKKEMRERAELARIERNKSRWGIKARELNEKEKEKEKETSAERKFRLASETYLAQKQWREQINALMTRKPETAVRFDAVDTPLSSNIEEGSWITSASQAMRTRKQRRAIIIINILFFV